MYLKKIQRLWFHWRLSLVRLRLHRLLLGVAFLLVCVFILASLDHLYIPDRPNPNERTIFFLETSGASKLHGRQACSVEAAAKHHPKERVLVYLLTEKVEQSDSLQKILQENYPNIEFLELNLESAFSETPLEPWYLRTQWMTSKYKVAHLSDATRLGFLYKYGGIYQDLDSLTVKSFRDLVGNNTIGIQNEENEDYQEFSNGVMVFQPKNLLVQMMMEYIRDHYNPNDWSGNGPVVMEILLQNKCPGLGYCSAFDINVMSRQYFIPIYYTEIIDVAVHQILQRHLKESIENVSYAVHFYNSQLSTVKEIPEHSLYAELARNHCPLVYEMTKLTCSFCSSEWNKADIL